MRQDISPEDLIATIDDTIGRNNRAFKRQKNTLEP
jgi:hypothetical protein